MVFENFGLDYVKCCHFKINVIVVFVQLLTCMNEFFSGLYVVLWLYNTKWCDVMVLNKRSRKYCHLSWRHGQLLFAFFTVDKKVYSLSQFLSRQYPRQIKRDNSKTVMEKQWSIEIRGSQQLVRDKFFGLNEFNLSRQNPILLY